METILDEFRQKGKNQFVWEVKGFEKGEYLFQIQASDVESGETFIESTIQVLLK